MSENTFKEQIGVPIPLLIGILASFGDDAVNTAIMPIMSSVAMAFPDIPYTTIIWLYSMPKIIIIPFALLGGYLAGRKVRFKTIALVGLGIISLAGIMPFFLDNFWMILASRMVLAIGLGLQAPMGPALVMRFFRRGKQRSLVLGFGNGALNAFSIVTGLAVGNLCVIDWHLSFLAYGGMIILFLLTFFLLKEPPLEERNGSDAAERASFKIGSKKRNKEFGIPAMVIVLCGFFCLVDCVWMPASLNISSILASNNWGDSAMAGVLVSFISVSGLAAGLLFGPYCRATRQFNISVSLAIMAIGLACIYFANGVALIGLGLILGGSSFCLIICGVQNEIGAVCIPGKMALATGMFMVFEHFGGFLSSWWMSLIMGIFGEDAFLAPVGVAIVFFAIASVVFVLYGIRRRSDSHS